MNIPRWQKIVRVTLLGLSSVCNYFLPTHSSSHMYVEIFFTFSHTENEVWIHKGVSSNYTREEKLYCVSFTVLWYIFTVRDKRSNVGYSERISKHIVKQKRMTLYKLGTTEIRSTIKTQSVIQFNPNIVFLGVQFPWEDRWLNKNSNDAFC